ncbi:MAG: hypothetical protein ABIH67_03490 [Candidatus Uhrbacteria bacterium]
MKKTNTTYKIIGLALIMIGVFVAVSFVLVGSMADEVTMNTLVPNSSPSIDYVYISNNQYGFNDDYSNGTITGLIGGSTKTIHINGIVSDVNGDEDISSVSVSFYRTNHADAYDCSADANDCYQDDTGNGCSIDTTYGDTTQAKFDCPLNLQYYIDATDSDADNYSGTSWTVYVTVTDDDYYSDTDSSITKDIESFVSLNIPSTIDFGALALGASTTSDNNVEMTVEQYGNMMADVEVAGEALTCDVNGIIPMANMEWSLSDVGVDADGTYDISADATDTDFNIGLRTTSSVTKSIYWNITIPASGVEGTCSGTTTITAKAAD